jgi:hypothetical protein
MPASMATHRRTESITRTADDAAYRGEHLTLRNHDERTGYGITLRVSDADGRVLERTGYYLGSGTTKRVYDVADVGPVTVEVVHAGEFAGAVTTRLDDSREGTVVIECGNGVVTVTEGHA